MALWFLIVADMKCSCLFHLSMQLDAPQISLRWQ